MLDVVSVVRSGDDLLDSFERGLNLLGGLRPEGLPVMIKPNICVERDESGGAITSIGVVKAAVDAVLKGDRQAAVRIVESDSDGKWLDKAYENFGYLKMADDYRDAGYDVRLVNLSAFSWLNVGFPFPPLSV